MSEAAAILITAALTGFAFLALWPRWAHAGRLWQTGPLERQHPDYRHINEVELDLGLPLSDYRAQGVDAIGMLEERSTEVLNGNQRAIEKLDDQLNPEQALRKQVSAAFAVPPHILLEGCPTCGHAPYHPRTPCSVCGWRTWRTPSPTQINAMDEPYPVEVMPPAAGVDELYRRRLWGRFIDDML